MENNKQVQDWMYQQSGVIPYRFQAGELEILLITSRRQKRWIIPKGIIEPDMTALESAITEAWEEAGITGRVIDDVFGHYDYHKWGGTCHVAVFLFEVSRLFTDWPEVSMRERTWVNLETAIDRVEELDLKLLLKQVPDYLAQRAS